MLRFFSTTFVLLAVMLIGSLVYEHSTKRPPTPSQQLSGCEVGFVNWDCRCPGNSSLPECREAKQMVDDAIAQMKGSAR